MPAARDASAAGPVSMSERFVIVHRTYDSLQADLLGDLLRDAGVNARVTGTRSGALIGVAQNILEVHIAVPESQAGAATDFLEAYLSAEPVPVNEGEAGAEMEVEGGLGDDGDGDGDGDDLRADRPVELRPLLAAGSAFLTFGVGHLYARRPITAAALLVGQVVAMLLLFTGEGWYDWTIGLTMLGGIVACDVVGAVIASREQQRGVRRGKRWQAALGVVYVGGTLFLAHGLGPLLVDPKAGDPTGGWRKVQRLNQSPIEQIDRPLQRDPSFPPLTSEHPANPSARHRP